MQLIDKPSNVLVPARDLAGGAGGMPLQQLESMIEDIRLQPEWRTHSDRAAAFYDGHQLTAARIAEMEQAGQPISITNLMQRAINGALGTEAKARLNWKVTSDDDDGAEVASVVNQKLAQAQRETNADMAVSDAYKSELVAGLGWVEVSRNPDPLAFPYQVQEVHRNEIWWDWRARRKDLKDARWLVRQRWVDIDEAKVGFPKYAKILEHCLTEGPIHDTLRLVGIRGYESLERVREMRNTFKVNQEEWLDSTRKRVRMYECWYTVPVKVVAIEDNDGVRVRFDPKNTMHQAALERGTARLISGPSYVIRRAMFAGPYRLSDIETKRRSYPYIPFWCYRQDDTRAPYGMGEGMISPQEEYNERRSKLLWLLRTAQVFVDHDALKMDKNNFIDLAREILRPDAVVIMNENRKNGANGLRVEHNLQLAVEQVNVMQDAKQLIQEQPGVYSTVLGDAPTGVTSGLAINSLVEQSAVALGEINDNFRFGRRAVGEALTDLIVEDMQRPGMRAKIGSGKKARVVVLNAWTPEGEPINQVAAVPLKTGLEDVPSTPAYRMQQQQNLTNVITAMGANPAAIAVLAPAYLEMSDIPNKDIYADWMRKQAGVPDPNDQAQEGEDDPSAQAEAQAQVLQMEQARLALEELAAKVRDIASRAELNMAKTAEIQARLLAPPQVDPEQAAIDEAINEARQPQPMAA